MTDTVLNASVKTPWEGVCGDVPMHLEYPEETMTGMVFRTARAQPDDVAWEFMGAKRTYAQLRGDILRCAAAFIALGVKRGERVTLCLPNCPQAIEAFYALNWIGAVASMIHPLSAEGEIKFYLNEASSGVVVTLDAFYDKFDRVRGETPLKRLILTGVARHMPPLTRLGYKLTEGRKIAKLPFDADFMEWGDFLALSAKADAPSSSPIDCRDDAVILFSGGTTGTTKGIMLSSLNFNALALQITTISQCVQKGDKMLAILPMFHGFGLGVCIHTMLVDGCVSVLVPRFNAQSFARMIGKLRPAFIVGVPTLYEALLRDKTMQRADLSCLKGAFSGGDSLSVDLKRRFDDFLKEHNASITLREGYGTTECVTASCISLKDDQREGSVGVPVPDTLYKIVDPATLSEMPYGENGEICIHGPSVMKGYINRPEETAQVLRPHADGLTWLHTGDIGAMCEEGFIYFKQRLKRLIISSGYNIFPSQLENVLDAHPAVSMSCAIGVPDPVRMQKVKAFCVLKPGYAGGQALKDELLLYMSQNVSKWSLPYDIEFRDELPLTRVGKVAFTVLEDEESRRLTAFNDAQAAGV